MTVKNVDSALKDYTEAADSINSETLQFQAIMEKI